MGKQHLSDSVISGRHRRVSRGRVRDIEYRRRAVGATDAAESGFARYIGRVGLLAVALGVGSAIGSMPLAFADTTGSAGSNGSASADASSSVASTKPGVSSRRPGHGSQPNATSDQPATSAGSARSGGVPPAAVALTPSRRNAGNSASAASAAPATIVSAGDSAVDFPASVVSGLTVAATSATPATGVSSAGGGNPVATQAGSVATAAPASRVWA